MYDVSETVLLVIIKSLFLKLKLRLVPNMKIVHSIKVQCYGISFPKNFNSVIINIPMFKIAV